MNVSNLSYGEKDGRVTEKWNFSISENLIRLEIERMIQKAIVVEEAEFPAFSFNSMDTRNGAFLGYGGLAWLYFFNRKLCTYGVHSNSSVFWNSTTGDGLKVKMAADEKQAAMKFSRTDDDHFGVK